MTLSKYGNGDVWFFIFTYTLIIIRCNVLVMCLLQQVASICLRTVDNVNSDESFAQILFCFIQLFNNR